jgi:tetratricopeptide (TPR) repeat protein
LIRYGIPEAAPLVLSDAVASQSVPQVRSVAMNLLIDGLVDAADNEGPEAARRVFAAAPILLAEADKGGAKPSSARVRSLMGSIEVRAGNLAAAEPLLRQAVKAEPTTAGYTLLAQVDRQSGNLRAAIDALGQAARAPDARSSVLDLAEADLLGFEVYRDSGAQADAQRSLDAALAAALAGRQQRGNAATRARAERLLGRILERYGESKGAARAFERALSAAAADKPTFGAAMLDAIGRALIRRDLLAARASLKKGLEADVGEDDLVYGALWVQLLEKDLKAPPDGIVERALHAGTHTQWTAKLTAWASGKISDSDLTTAAQSASQKVEAAFYTAMASRANGDPSAEQRLRAVATAPVIDLLEVQLAREMVSKEPAPSLPGGVSLP